jgi:hypothetical protein
MSKAFIIAAGIVAVAGFCIGCGTGGETATASLTKAQFIKQAGAICEKYTKQREAAADFKKHRPGGYTEAARHIDEQMKEVAAPSLQEQAEELKTLSPPEKDAEKIDRMFENLAQAADDIAAEGFKGVARSNWTDFEAEAEAYGLKGCVST